MAADDEDSGCLLPQVPRDSEPVSLVARAASTKQLAYQQQQQQQQQTRRKAAIQANLSGTKFFVVVKAVENVGLQISQDDDLSSPYLFWSDAFVSQERVTELRSHQRVNHFPGMGEICRKDLLGRNMARAAKLLPEEFDFVPRTWCLPAEFAQFTQHARDLKRADQRRSFISKPANGSMGHGIRIFTSAQQVPPATDSVVQEYIANPFLIDGYKCDLRLYVLVTSCDPLRIFFYDDGLLRLSTEKYQDPQRSGADALCMHLTNYSINKRSDQYERGDDDSTGSKRSIRFLNEYLQQRDYDVALLWRNIVDLVVKTVMLAHPQLLQSYRLCRPAAPPGANSVCFELLGFDILLDHKLKPWLIEVNRSPSFAADEPIDFKVKLGLVEETLKLLRIRQSDKMRHIQAQKAQAQKRLLKGLSSRRNSSTDELGGQRALKRRQQLAKRQEELEATLVRLKREAQREEHEMRTCRHFRRVFPSDDRARQERYAGILLAVFSAFMHGRAAALAKELEGVYGSKLRQDDVTEMLEQVRQEMDGRAPAPAAAHAMDFSSSSDWSSDDESEMSTDASSRRASSFSRDSSTRPSASASKLPSVHGRRRLPSRSRSVRCSARPASLPAASSAAASVADAEFAASASEEAARCALASLGQLSIKFPGKSAREAEALLAKVRENWKFYRPRVASYWLVKLDADRRRQLLDIVRQNVRVTLQKSLGRLSDPEALPLHRAIARLFARLLCSNGQGLWATFSAPSSWEPSVGHLRDSLGHAEMACCRRVVQLCQDCLLTVFLYSANGGNGHTDPQMLYGTAASLRARVA